MLGDRVVDQAAIDEIEDDLAGRGMGRQPGHDQPCRNTPTKRRAGPASVQQRSGRRNRLETTLHQSTALRQAEDEWFVLAFSGFANYDCGSQLTRRDQPEAGMHVISLRRLREFWGVHADAEEPLIRWFKLAEKAKWTNFAELRAVCPSADRVDQLTVINIGGNKYRLILEIFFQDRVILIRQVLTHKEYDKGEWKSRSPAREREVTERGNSMEEGTKPKGNGEDRSRRSRR
ncbi:MAG: type II toxin-antitoxin system HigB family toxin [Isosphaerales bacterium]